MGISISGRDTGDYDVYRRPNLGWALTAIFQEIREIDHGQ